MTLSVLIPAELQIGAVDVEVARKSGVERALQMAIERNLFDGPEALEKAIAGFEARMHFYSVSNKTAKAYWKLLNPSPAAAEDEATVPAPSGTRAIQLETVPQKPWQNSDIGERPMDRGPKAALFCLALQGLSGAFAAAKLGWSDAGKGSAEDVSVVQEEDEEDEDPDLNYATGPDDGADLEEATAAIDAKPGVLYSTVQWGIAELLRGRTWKLLSQVSADPVDRSEAARLTSAVLLEAIVQVLGQWFEITQDGKGKPRGIVLKDQALIAKLGKFQAELPFYFTPQPLREPVRYELDHGPTADDETPGFHVDLIGYRRRNAFITKFHEGAMLRKNRSPHFESYVEAVNAQMAVAWRINRPLYNIIRSLTQIVAKPSSWDAALRQKLADSGLDSPEITDLRNWVGEKLFRPKGTRGRATYGLPGEFLDHGQAESVFDELVKTAQDTPKSRFFLVWKADFRGRIYAYTSWLTPQGSDVQRALLEFADGGPLDANGVKALRRHGANLVSSGRILSDLKVEGRQVVTLDERQRWVDANEGGILASAADPFRGNFWRGEGIKEPIQFLGFCLAYADWKANPDAFVHLPTQIDGTCNGLQHIAALTGDINLACAVNVLPNDHGLPGDIYSQLAKEAAQGVDRKTIEKGPNLKMLRFGNNWLDANGPVERFLDRDTAKAVIMTIPYGAAQSTQAAKVLSKIEKKIENAWKQHTVPDGLSDLIAWVDKSKGRKKVVENITKGCFEALQAEAKEEARLGNKKAHDQLWHLQVLAAYVSLTLVGRLRHTLSTEFPVVDAFSKWLRAKASRASGLPLVWLTPLGFPVCQNKFVLPPDSSITAKLGGSEVRLDLGRMSMEVSRSGQSNGLMPNLIHSLDSTHLAMVLLAAKSAGLGGLGTIHDCLQCHPNDADSLGEIVRAQFARLYAPDASGQPAPRADWENWMDLLGRLRIPDQAKTLVTVLDYPNGAAARNLPTIAASDAPAANAQALLPELEKLDAPQTYMAKAVLDFVGEHFRVQESKKPPTGGKTSTDDPAPKRPDPRIHSSEFGLTSALRLNLGKAMSPYFFS